MSFYTALTGLNGAQTDIATISNNIANVGTTGFKQSRVQFGDIFATSPLQNATSAVGEGTIVKSIQQEFTQGSIQSSANTTDLAISGQGFFALKPSLTSTQTVYSRDGSFSVNSDRYVVDNQGQFLQVFPVNSDGSATSTDAASATNLQLPLNSGLPKATSAIQLGINLPAAATIIPASSTYNSSNPYVFNKDDASTYNQSTSITIYDSLGNPTIATIYYVKTSNSTSTDPTNKWATHVYVGDKELNPSLITAKNPQGQTLYVNKFGQTTTDPTQVGNPNSSAYVPGATSDPAFIAGQPGPLYYQDDQTDTSTSTPASVTSATPPVNGFNFGSTDNNPVTIVTDPSQYQNTYESDPSHTSTYWGTDMFTVSVDGSTPQSISINAGTYTGTQLAAEMTRAVNAKFSGANSYQITDTYRTGDGSLISGNDVFNIGLSGTDASGGSMALNPPLQIDLLGTAGSSGTPQVAGAGAQPIPNTNLTQQQLVDLAQAKINEQLNARATEFGATNGWVTSSKEPIKVGYDVASRSLTFTADPTLLGADAILPGNRYSSIQVYNPTSSTNNLGIPTQASSPTAVIGSSTPWQGEATLPSGPPLGGTVQKNGITITYDKNAQKFTFSSGTTGENSSIEVGRAALTPPGQNTPQVSTYKLTQLPSLTAGSNFTLESKGQTFNYIVPSTLNMTSPTDQQALVAGLQQAVPAYIGQPQVTQTGGSGVSQLETIAFSGNLLPGDVYHLSVPGISTPIEIDAGTLTTTAGTTTISNWTPDATKTPAANLLACLSTASSTALAAAGITVGLSSDGTSLTFKYANTGTSTPIASSTPVTSLSQSARGVAYTATTSGSTTTYSPVTGQNTFDLLPPTVTTSPTITMTTGNSNTQEVQTTKFSSTSPNANVKILPGDQFIISIPGANGSLTTKTVTMPAYSGGSTGLWLLQRHKRVQADWDVVPPADL